MRVQQRHDHRLTGAESESQPERERQQRRKAVRERIGDVRGTGDQQRAREDPVLRDPHREGGNEQAHDERRGGERRQHEPDRGRGEPDARAVDRHEHEVQVPADREERIEQKRAPQHPVTHQRPHAAVVTRTRRRDRPREREPAAQQHDKRNERDEREQREGRGEADVIDGDAGGQRSR